MYLFDITNETNNDMYTFINKRKRVRVNKKEKNLNLLQPCYLYLFNHYFSFFISW
jgi:hypothetical protein